MERITSPVAIPYVAAGLAASPGASATSMVGNRLVIVGSSNTENATQNPISASNRFIAGPAKIMRARFHDFWARNVRGSSTGSMSVSMPVMPGVFTYAPSGMALMPYSTSPRRKLQMRGPNPMKNSVTFIPDFRATM